MGHIATVGIYLLVINTLTFLTYGYDKTAAVKNHRRIPENKLHLMELIGGSPAAMIAQLVFRHKTKKGSFQIVFWAIVVVQVFMVGMLINKGILN